MNIPFLCNVVDVDAGLQSIQTPNKFYSLKGKATYSISIAMAYLIYSSYIVPLWKKLDFNFMSFIQIIAMCTIITMM
jgi:hypothetical protein